MGAPSTRHLVLHNKGVSPPELNCFLKPCKQLSPEVAQLLSAADGPLVAYGNFAYQPEFLQVPAPNPLTVLHALSGGSGPDVRLLPDTQDPGARDAFNVWHQTDLAQGRCTVVRFPNRDLELVLVPVVNKTGATGTPGPVYWGFTVTANLLPLMARVIHAAKLMVVFDIDETLLMAHTVDSLQTRLQRAKAEREAKEAELAAAEAAVPARNPNKVQELKETVVALKSEQALLRKDFEMLSFFRQDPACRAMVDGQIVEPSWECTTMSTGVEVTRPVVRLEVDGNLVILTRIYPESRSTSLLIRPRPGWESLRTYLSDAETLQTMGFRKERWEVYLCTTAEREYAWEAWRLLDPQASIFPLHQLDWRMLCVQHPQKKDLLNVLRKQDIDAAVKQGFVARCPSDPQFVTDKTRAARPPVGNPVPLCVVVDDRLDVWEEDSRKAVLQVMPFHPHKEAAALQLGPDAVPPHQYQRAVDSEQELVRVMATLRDVRSLTYQTLDKEVKPEVQRLTTTGVMDQLQDTTASILATLLVPVKSVPQLLAESPHKPPAALGSSDKDERASDLRLLVHDVTMMQAANNANSHSRSQQQQRTGAAAAGGGGPSDPRKRRSAVTDSKGAAQGVRAAAAAAGAEQQQQGLDQDQEQQQPRAKKRKKEKVKLFDGVDLAGIMTTIGNEEQQDMQADMLDGGGGGGVEPGPAAAAAKGGGGGGGDQQQQPQPQRRRSSHSSFSSDRELNLDTDEDEQQPQQQQQQQQRRSSFSSDNELNLDTDEDEQQEQQQQQHQQPAGRYHGSSRGARTGSTWLHHQQQPPAAHAADGVGDGDGDSGGGGGVFDSGMPGSFAPFHQQQQQQQHMMMQQQMQMQPAYESDDQLQDHPSYLQEGEMVMPELMQQQQQHMMQQQQMQMQPGYLPYDSDDHLQEGEMVMPEPMQQQQQPRSSGHQQRYPSSAPPSGPQQQQQQQQQLSTMPAGDAADVGFEEEELQQQPAWGTAEGFGGGAGGAAGYAAMPMQQQAMLQQGNNTTISSMPGSSMFGSVHPGGGQLGVGLLGMQHSSNNNTNMMAMMMMQQQQQQQPGGLQEGVGVAGGCGVPAGVVSPQGEMVDTELFSQGAVAGGAHATANTMLPPMQQQAYPLQQQQAQQQQQQAMLMTGQAGLSGQLQQGMMMQQQQGRGSNRPGFKQGGRKAGGGGQQFLGQQQQQQHGQQQRDQQQAQGAPMQLSKRKQRALQRAFEHRQQQQQLHQGLPALGSGVGPAQQMMFGQQQQQQLQQVPQNQQLQGQFMNNYQQPNPNWHQQNAQGQQQQHQPSHNCQQQPQSRQQRRQQYQQQQIWRQQQQQQGHGNAAQGVQQGGWHNIQQGMANLGQNQGQQQQQQLSKKQRKRNRQRQQQQQQLFLQ